MFLAATKCFTREDAKSGTKRQSSLAPRPAAPTVRGYNSRLDASVCDVAAHDGNCGASNAKGGPNAIRQLLVFCERFFNHEETKSAKHFNNINSFFTDFVCFVVNNLFGCG